MDWSYGRYVTHRELNKILRQIDERIEQMASQQDVDQLTGQVGQVAQDLESARGKLQSEIDQLAQQNPQLDLSGLQAAVAPLDGAVQTLGDLKPAA